MLSNSTLPDWPLPDGELIGKERAREYIAWIRSQAPSLIAEGRRQLTEQHGGIGMGTSAVTVGQLAGWMLSPEIGGLSIGCVYCSINSGAWAMMDIVLRRDGHLELKRGWNMKC